ncbi:hypothetical protein K8R43_03545 [archaeon]|nr:hypothetical protein [archaeon]
MENKYDIRIVNMVASASLNEEIDLFNLARKEPTVEYEPEQFPGAVLKLKTPKVSFLVFRNGKIVCTGAKNEKVIELAMKKMAGIVRKYATKR